MATDGRIEIIGSWIGRRLAVGSIAWLGLFCRNDLGDTLRDLTLHCENVGELSIIYFAPVGESGGGIDKVHSDAHSIAILRNTAHQKLPGMRSLLDACGLDVLLCQSSDNCASDALGEISVVGLAAQVFERQHGDRLIGRRHWRH